MNYIKSHINALHPLAPSTWAQLEAIFIQKTLPKDAYFVEDNVVARYIGFLQTGIVRAFYRTSDGKEYNKHFFQPPTLIGGYSSLITGAPNQINQQALTNCVVWVAEYSKLTALYDTCPDLATAARKLAERHFVEKENREIELVLLDAEQRYMLMKQRLPDLELLIPQYHIASYLGVSPTQLSRIRRKLAKS